jgi:hypothetical protein
MFKKSCKNKDFKKRFYILNEGKLYIQKFDKNSNKLL